MGRSGDPPLCPGDGLHLDHHGGIADPGEEIHLGPADPPVPLHDGGAAADQEVGGERLADRTELGAPPDAG